jgi:FemAB-related protein (PEP-CTERM system-associated)
MNTVTGSSDLIISEASDSDSAAWDEFVFSRPEASVFHRWAWRQVLTKEFGHRPHYLLAKKSGVLVGVLPLLQVKTLFFGHSLVSIPFGHYAGPLFTEEHIASALIEYAAILGETLGVEHVELRQMSSPKTDWPKNTSLYVTFRKSISADAEENLAAIPRKQRAMVRKAMKNELSAGLSDATTFFQLYSDNMHRHGSPTYSQKYFELLMSHFGKDADIWVVRDKNGKPLTGVLSLYHGAEAFPIYAGDYEAARDLAANDFKYWTLMTHAATKGCSIFNFGRSKVDTGSYSFKKNWGFEPTALTYEYKLLKRQDIPQNNPSNPKFQLVVSLWRKTPRPIVNWLGPILVKGLG